MAKVMIATLILLPFASVHCEVDTGISKNKKKAE